MLERMTPALLLDHFAVAVSALSGVLAARRKGLDLFGALVLALVTALGGGSVRDMLAGAGAAAWLRMPELFGTVCVTALIAFFSVRHFETPGRWLVRADALALCAFAVAGTHKGLALGFAPVVSIALGVITGVAGGIIRDTLTGSVPLVFRKDSYFYATAAFAGGLLYWLLRDPLGSAMATWVSVCIAIALRLGSIHFRLSLPFFESEDPSVTN